MRTIKTMYWALMALATHAAMAESGPLQEPNPLGDLQSQIDVLAGRVQTLESNVPTAEVDGRSYCMMVTVTVLRGIANTATPPPSRMSSTGRPESASSRTCRASPRSRSAARTRKRAASSRSASRMAIRGPGT
jgi:hypothetical protein